MQQLLMGCAAAQDQAAGGVALEDFTASSFTVGTTATAQYRLSNDGSIDATQGTNTIQNVGFWFEDVDSPSDYECRATADPGEVSSGTLNTWLSLGTSRTWTLSSPTVSGVLEGEIFVEIRRASDQVVLDSATITLQAERGS